MDMDAAKSGDMPRAKSWRGFLIEIGTIIVGILIALGVNQVVDDLRERRITQEARTAVRAEIASNLGGMLLRRGTQACIDRRLEQMGQILEAARDGRLPHLVELGDLRGEMHCHSTWSSDGKEIVFE